MAYAGPTKRLRQDVLDRVATHMLTQKRRSLLPDDADPECPDAMTRCAYRGADGAKCAVGCLIPDELYTRDLEGHGVGSDVVRPVLLRALNVHGFLLRNIRPMLRRLQSLHDSTVEITNAGERELDESELFRTWRAGLLAMANEYDLTTDKWETLK